MTVRRLNLSHGNILTIFLDVFADYDGKVNVAVTLVDVGKVLRVRHLSATWTP